MPRLPVLLSNVAPIVAVGKGPKVTPLGRSFLGFDVDENSDSRGGGEWCPVEIEDAVHLGICRQFRIDARSSEHV